MSEIIDVTLKLVVNQLYKDAEFCLNSAEKLIAFAKLLERAVEGTQHQKNAVVAELLAHKPELVRRATAS
jgi:hypothetical protein